jgi:HK97 gp10 family phage protein
LASIVEITYNRFAEKGAELAMKQVIAVTCVRIHGQAVALCPVDYGQLANSLMWKTSWEQDGFNTGASNSQNKGGTAPGGSVRKGSGSEPAPGSHKISKRPRGLMGYVGTNSDHWYPEFGTRYQRAQPFMRPAKEVVEGGNAKTIAKKYGAEAMAAEFMKRKIERRIQKING